MPQERLGPGRGGDLVEERVYKSLFLNRKRFPMTVKQRASPPGSYLGN